jgi:hypothetical protein
MPEEKPTPNQSLTAGDGSGMPEEKPTPNQSLTAGDGSNNYQAARDVTVHNHTASPAPQSLVERPTNAQIAEFDPKTGNIIRIARREIRFLLGYHQRRRMYYQQALGGEALGLLLFAASAVIASTAVIAAIELIYKIGAWLWRLMLGS